MLWRLVQLTKTAQQPLAGASFQWIDRGLTVEVLTLPRSSALLPGGFPRLRFGNQNLQKMTGLFVETSQDSTAFERSLPATAEIEARP
jgi:hypothetical protein